jgi:ABC-type sugar transport system ATPase subunit
MTEVAGHSDVPTLRMLGISKRFLGIQALTDVTFEAQAGEVHAIVGENGAGKSTLMKIMSGVHEPDEGSIEIDGRSVRFSGPHDSQQLGVAMVYQEFDLVPEQSVAENILLGRQPINRFGFVRRSELRRQGKVPLDELQVDLDPSLLVRALSAGQRQLVQIAQAFSREPRIMVFDEPTSALTEHETHNLFGIIRRLKDRGVAVVYISHRLGEVMTIADRVTALRDGHLIATKAISEVSPDHMVELIVGRTITELFPKQEVEIAEAVLEVRDLSSPPKFDNISFSVRAGEIVGMAGLVGAGRTEIARAIFGLDKRAGGTVTVRGMPIASGRVDSAIRSGLSFVPEERKIDGLVLDETISQNIALSSLQALAKFWIISRRRERTFVQALVERLNVRPPALNRQVMTLSGGNQQKVVLAKSLGTSPKVLILDEPTAGIDVASKAEIHRLIGALAATGVAVLLISSELTEVIAASDRILVVFAGRIVDEVPRALATEQRIIRAAMGYGNAASDDVGAVPA